MYPPAHRVNPGDRFPAAPWAAARSLLIEARDASAKALGPTMITMEIPCALA
jgi:hypothetical protein